MTANEFIKANEEFRALCKQASIEPSKRQARRFMRKSGSAYWVIQDTSDGRQRRIKRMVIDQTVS